MRLLKKAISGKPPSGFVDILPEDDEDLWHAYNLIHVGDSVTAGTFRKVVRESSSGATSSERKAITLTIQIEAMDYDAEGGSLRIKGVCVSQNRFVSMGSYHSIELAVGRKFKLEKSHWDFMAFERLKTATDVGASADLAALLLAPGSATLVLLKGELSVTRAQIDVNIPKRRGAASGHEKAQDRFMQQIVQAVEAHVDFDKVKALLLASPGFVREEVFTYIMEYASRNGIKSLLSNKGKMLQVHTSSGGTRALAEALAEPQVAKLLQDTKAAAQVAALNHLYELMEKDEEKVTYGNRFVSYAVENAAVETLLVTDEMFRSTDLGVRAANIALVEGTQHAGGTVHIFSTQHDSGQRLALLGGVAAILRFPLPEAEEMAAAVGAGDGGSVSSDEEELYAELGLAMAGAGYGKATDGTQAAVPATDFTSKAWVQAGF